MTRTRKIISLTDHLPKSPTGAEEALRSAKVAEVREWIVAGCLAAGQKAYEQLAEQHGAIFQYQEEAFMAVAQHLDDRLRALEVAAGIPSPALTSIRDALDAILPPQEANPDEPSEPEPEPPTPRIVP